MTQDVPDGAVWAEVVMPDRLLVAAPDRFLATTARADLRTLRERAMTRHVPEGMVWLEVAASDRSVAARQLLAAAERAGLPVEVVVSQSDGYLVPEAVVEAMAPARPDVVGIPSEPTGKPRSRR